MKSRCENPNRPKFKDYGNRGIEVCEEWKDSWNFVQWAISHEYRKGLQLDRIDNDKGYVVCQTLKRYVKRQQSADVAPARHGRWVWDERFKDYTCSECHNWDLKAPNYCSNCGRRMDGGTSDGTESL